MSGKDKTLLASPRLIRALGAYLLVLFGALLVGIFHSWSPQDPQEEKLPQNAVEAMQSLETGVEALRLEVAKLAASDPAVAGPPQEAGGEVGAAGEPEADGGDAGSPADPAAATEGGDEASAGGPEAAEPSPTAGAGVDQGAGGDGETEPAEAEDNGEPSQLVPRDDEVRLLSIALLFGGLGSWLHAAASFGVWIGRRRFEKSWIWWYLTRPFVGATLGMLFYIVVRAGLIASSSTSEAVSQFGVAAFAGLAGLFTEQATKKLKEVFDTIFRTESEQRDDAAEENPAPTITAVDPAEVTAGQPTQVSIRGAGFVDGETEVTVDGKSASPSVVDANTLSVELTGQQTGTSLELVVRNPAPGGGEAKTKVQVV